MTPVSTPMARGASGKILGQAALAAKTGVLQSRGKKLVFTNGCFDILHAGHVRYLQSARNLGDALIVAVNGDSSVRKIKGPLRPLTPQKDRLNVLAGLECVTYLTLFSAATPLRLIERIAPDILVKGGDWPVEKIVGGDFVKRGGGKVLSIPLVKGISTTEIIRKIVALNS